MLNWLADAVLGSTVTLEQVVGEKQRHLARVVRELDWERKRIEREERKLVPEMKALARDGHMQAVKMQARGLMRARRQYTQLVKTRTQMQAVSSQLSALKSTHQVSQAMRGVLQIMSALNQSLKLESVQRLMVEFARQNELMDGKTEAIGGAIDDAMAGSDDEAEESAMIARVLDDVGIDLGQEMADVPRDAAPCAEPQRDEVDAETEALLARLANLKPSD